MGLTVDTETDTYEQAIAAVQAAYGLRPDVPVAWPDTPAPDPRPGSDAHPRPGRLRSSLIFRIRASSTNTRSIVRPPAARPRAGAQVVEVTVLEHERATDQPSVPAARAEAVSLP